MGIAHTETERKGCFMDWSIWQLRLPESQLYAFLDWFTRRGMGALRGPAWRAAYRCVARGIDPHAGAEDLRPWLDALYARYNLDSPANYRGRSMSVSDIVQCGSRLFYCDAIGFVEITELADPLNGLPDATRAVLETFFRELRNRLEHLEASATHLPDCCAWAETVIHDAAGYWDAAGTPERRATYQRVLEDVAHGARSLVAAATSREQLTLMMQWSSRWAAQAWTLTEAFQPRALEDSQDVPVRG